MEEDDDDIDNNNLLFIKSNREKFDFNTFRMPLNFLSAIQNDEISLKEAEFKQKDLEEISNLKIYRNNVEKEEK